MRSSPRSSSGRSRASRTTRAPGSWPPRSIARSITSAATSGSNASTRSSAASSRPRRWPCRTSTAHSTTTSATTCCAWSSSSCHPVLSTEARVALTLRLLGGLTTEEIARAFLVPEPTIAQRIVRAKRTLAEAHVPFEVPRGRRARRPPAVGARGHLPRLQRGLLGHRRRRLDAARALRGRAAARADPRRARPQEPEVHGLVALMEIQASRSGARRAAGRARPAARSEPRALGSTPHPPRPRRARACRAAGRRPRARTRCRPRSPPVTREPSPRRRRTGRASSRSTMRSRSSRLRRSSS